MTASFFARKLAGFLIAGDTCLPFAWRLLCLFCEKLMNLFVAKWICAVFSVD